MQRDKRGRFVKKAYKGGDLVTINGKQFRIPVDAQEKHIEFFKTIFWKKYYS